MELRVEAVPGYGLPNGCFIGVRVGEVLKQGRYDPLCCYRFPTAERQRSAKIDLYQHVGTCSAIVDPDTKADNEVKVAVSEPGFSELRLKVSTKPEARRPEEAKAQVKKQAKDYLGRHRIEERLCNAVKALLAAQVEDPTEFLVAHLQESCPKKAAAKTGEDSALAPGSAAVAAAGMTPAAQAPPAAPTVQGNQPTDGFSTTAALSKAAQKPTDGAPVATEANKEEVIVRGLAAAAVTCACSPVGAGLASAAAAVADVAATSPSSACDIGSLRAAAALADMASGLAAAATAVAEAGSPVASGLIQAATDVAVAAVKARGMTEPAMSKDLPT